jgi:hypothetical protein
LAAAAGFTFAGMPKGRQLLIVIVPDDEASGRLQAYKRLCQLLDAL